MEAAGRSRAGGHRPAPLRVDRALHRRRRHADRRRERLTQQGGAAGRPRATPRSTRVRNRTACHCRGGLGGRQALPRAALDVGPDGRRHAATRLVAQAPEPASPLGRRQTRAVISTDLDAREALLAATQDEPRAADQVAGQWLGLGVLDPDVVEVGAALADRAPGLATALGQPGLDQQVDHRPQRRHRRRAGLAQRGREGGGTQGVEVAAAEERGRGGLGVLGLLGAVHERRDLVGQPLLPRRAATASRRPPPRSPRSRPAAGT